MIFYPIEVVWLHEGQKFKIFVTMIKIYFVHYKYWISFSEIFKKFAMSENAWGFGLCMSVTNANYVFKFCQ